MPGTLIVLIILAAVIAVSVISIVKRIKYGSSCCGTKDAAPSKVRVKDKNKKHYQNEYALKIDGMHCSGCVRKIENEFNINEGMWAKASLEKKEVILLSKTPIDEKTAGMIVSKAGFTMISMKKKQISN